MAKIENSTTPKVGVIMGSVSDWETMKEACDVLEQLQVAFEKKVVSAHRTPQWLTKYAEDAENRGLQVIIAGAGGAAHLPGMVASQTLLPVIGVPFILQVLTGWIPFIRLSKCHAEFRWQRLLLEEQEHTMPGCWRLRYYPSTILGCEALFNRGVTGFGMKFWKVNSRD